MLRLFRVIIDRQDEWIAGLLGNVEGWLVTENEGHPVALVSTDSADELMKRWDEDDNVCSYHEESNEYA